MKKKHCFLNIFYVIAIPYVIDNRYNHSYRQSNSSFFLHVEEPTKLKVKLRLFNQYFHPIRFYVDDFLMLFHHFHNNISKLRVLYFFFFQIKARSIIFFITVKKRYYLFK